MDDTWAPVDAHKERAEIAASPPVSHAVRAASIKSSLVLGGEAAGVSRACGILVVTSAGILTEAAAAYKCNNGDIQAF
jgi:hypothetical protein